ncbi:LA2681 family HEPN domain-containing protein [Dyella sp. M7H15-1]|uniref:LA2681 family HEPN domain-containing protein n=1 Tax=Dyella sp. M7H15-1 TaxID=2501295 RepID=UPI00197AD59D|nr:LA2681 family HEPN domain-containing protein [Dyella sp. M7H15-1]
MLAKIAHRHQDRVIQYAGTQAAEQIAAFASELEDPLPRSPHTDPFIEWVEHERLTLAPAVELIDATLGKLDWLMLPGIREREAGAIAMPPPVFAMFNVLKSDFILARDLAWRALDESAWPATGRFGDTLDYATYGPDASALILAHRTALDLLDKIAVTANHYFELGQPPNKIYFGKLWRRDLDKVTGVRPLAEKVEKTIRGGVSALYGLVELAEDYDSSAGILRSQKDLRNAGTHRFVVLHDFGDPAHSRQAPEIERHQRELFMQEALRALRVARSAIQMLALSISQHEQVLARRTTGIVGSLVVPDHDWIRGRAEDI